MTFGNISYGYYEYARTLANLVDLILIDLKTSGIASAAKQEELGRLLEGLDNPRKDLQAYFVYTLLSDSVGAELTHWKQLGEALRTQKPNTKAIPLLEKLAASLQEEQADLLYLSAHR